MRLGLMTRTVDAAEPAGVDVIGILAALRTRGEQPRVMTASGEAGLATPVMHYADAPFLLDGDGDVLIYHHSAPDPAGLAMVRRMRCRVIVRCMGAGSGPLLSRYSTELGRSAHAARLELAELAELRVESFMAASVTEAAALRDAGVAADRIQLVPPFHDADDLLGKADEASVVSMMHRNVYTVLTAGPLSPEHGMDDVVEQLAETVGQGSLDLHVHHIGKHDARLQSFINRVGGLVAQHGIASHITFHGQVTRPVMATLYRHCDVFWACDRPEAPVTGAVTAMAFGKPILAAPTSTLRAVCVDTAVYSGGAEDTAQALPALLGDALLRLRIGRAARARYVECCRSSVLRQRFLRRFDRALTWGSREGSASALLGDHDWFGLPRHREFLRTALPLGAPVPPFGLAGRDSRLAVVDWILQHGRAASSEVAAYLASDDFQTYARELHMPNMASHFSPEMRLVSTFHLPAICRFDLSRQGEISDFHRWFEREGAGLYKV